MKKLDELFTKRGFTYKQVKRTENCALYEVKEGDNPVFYEVFFIGFQKGGGFNGIVFEEKEMYPSDERFGASAWCCSTLDRVRFVIKEKNLDLDI